MRKRRDFVEGTYYHVTSRTNNKIEIFSGGVGRKMILVVLEEAKEKYKFRLANFCIMPTHIHLLIQPDPAASLSSIMHWIKLHSAKSWNFIQKTTDHVWGNRYFARPIKDDHDFEVVMNYIDQNPIEAGLVKTASQWPASGAFYRAHNIPDLVD